MTEAEWWEKHDLLLAGATERQGILFGAACCRRVERLMPDERYRAVIDAAERLVDDSQVTKDQLYDAISSMADPLDHVAGYTPVDWGAAIYMGRAIRHLCSRGAASHAASFARRGYARTLGVTESREWVEACDSEGREQQHLLQDILGRSPLVLNPSWLTSTVIALAEGIYQERAFDRLPILADALQDAGCEDGELLGHCRGPGPHVRGCWAVEGVTGKG